MLKTTDFDRHQRRDVPNSVLETWSISIERIRLDNEMVYKVLHISRSCPSALRVSIVESPRKPESLLFARKRHPATCR